MGDDEKLGIIEILLGIFCSGIGCILGIVYAVQGKPKGTKLIILSVVMIIVWNVIRFGLAAAGG